MNKIILTTLLLLTRIGFASEIATDSELYKREFSAKIAQNFQTNLTAENIGAEVKELLANSTIQKIDLPEFVILANRNPKAQTLSIYLTDGKTAEYIGTSKVSTGMENRKEYFLTPLGLYENKPENGNYRAVGTKNEYGVRGLGTAGMRVFDLGWQESVAGWGNRFPAQIRLQIHATDPNLLEQRLGTPASKGCIRIHHDVNKFIDEYGVLDKDFTNKNQWPLSKNKIATPYEGRYILIIDTEPTTP